MSPQVATFADGESFTMSADQIAEMQLIPTIKNASPLWCYSLLEQYSKYAFKVEKIGLVDFQVTVYKLKEINYDMLYNGINMSEYEITPFLINRETGKSAHKLYSNLKFEVHYVENVNNGGLGTSFYRVVIRFDE